MFGFFFFLDFVSASMTPTLYEALNFRLKSKNADITLFKQSLNREGDEVFEILQGHSMTIMRVLARGRPRLRVTGS